MHNAFCLLSANDSGLKAFILFTEIEDMADITPIKMQGGKEYVMVADRIRAFHEKNTSYSIHTEIVYFDPNFAVMKAVVTDASGNVATGHGRCTKEMASKAQGRFIEKAETTAIGRALAALGFGTAELLEDEDEDYIADSPVEKSSKKGSAQPSPKAVSGNESPSDPAPKPSDRTKRIGTQGEQELLALFASAFEDETERKERIEIIKTSENVAYLRDIFEHRHFAIANRLIEITNENERKQLDTPQKLGIDRVNRLKLAIDAAFGKVNRQKKMRLFCQQFRVRSLSELSVDQYNKLLTILQQAEKKRGNGIIEDGDTTPDDLVSDIIEDLAFVDTSSDKFKAFQASGTKKFGKRWGDVRKEIVIQVTHGEQTSAAKLRVIEMDEAFKALEAWEVEGVTA